MWQEIIVYIIISLSIVYPIFAYFFKNKKPKSMHNKKKCTNCPLKEHYCK